MADNTTKIASVFSQLKGAITLLHTRGLPWYVIFILVTLYYSTLLNMQLLSHFYRILEDSDNVSAVFAITPPLVLFSLLAIIFLCFLWRYVFKTVMACLIFAGAITGHFAYRYGTIFDYDMMVNLLQTHPAEAETYITFESVFNAFVFGFIPASLLLFTRIRWPKTFLRAVLGRLCILVCAAATIALIGAAYYQNYASIGRNNNILRKEISPYNFVWYGIKAIKQTYFPTKIEFQNIGADADIDNPGERPELFVVVLGETARAQNFRHNGYSRNTTPYTDDLPSSNFTKFAPVQSCGTATAVSVPCMFSNMKRSSYDETKAYNSTSLVDVLKYAGYRTIWFDNDGGCKGVCDRVRHENIDPDEPAFKGLCKNGTCYDEVMLKRLKAVLARSAKESRNTVIFLHLIGSHGPTYFERVPDDKKIFKPSCERGDIENCSVEQIVNSYDNTLSYTDYVVRQAIAELMPYQKDFGTALFYISDHGESLGENGLFLHGAPYAIAPDEQKRVPMMTWFSNSFIEDHHMNMKCLTEHAKFEFSHDNFYHSLLGILDANTSFYDEKLDFFSPCRKWERSPK